MINFRKIFESNSTEFDFNLDQEPYQDINQREYLCKKRQREIWEEYFDPNHNSHEESEEDLNLPNENPKEESIPKSIYLTFIKGNSDESPKEEEENDDNDKRYFNEAKTKKPFKVKILKDNLNKKTKIQSKENIQTNLDLSLKKRDNDTYLLPSSQGMEETTKPTINEVSHIITSNNSLIKSDSIPSKNSSSNLFIIIKSKQVETEKFIEKKENEGERRKYRPDDMRTKLMRSLYRTKRNKLNKILKYYGSSLKFRLFPQKIASETKKERIRKILNITLKEIISNKDLYNFKNENEKGFKNYKKNSKIVESEEIKNYEELQNILNKTFRQLYEDYINSDEFKVDEINRLKYKKKEDSNYIEKYKIIAQTFINFVLN